MLSSNDAKIDLVRQRMDALSAEMIAELNRAMFSDTAAALRTPITIADRVRLRVGRIQRYVETLWRALTGDDPYDVDWDY